MSAEPRMSEAVAAEELGLSPSALERLMTAAYALSDEPLMDQEPVLRVPVAGKPADEASELVFRGKVILAGGGVANYSFRLLIEGEVISYGSSLTPDWFSIIDAGGTELFVGEVEHPDDPDDVRGWSRYHLAFAPIRKVVSVAAFARLGFKIPLVDHIGASQQLGLPLGNTLVLASMLATIDPYTVTLSDDTEVTRWQDADGRDIWEVLYAGTLQTPEELVVQFYFVIGVQGMQRVYGSSAIDDKFTVVGTNGSHVFQGEVTSGRQNHGEEWAGYLLFNPVREAVVKAATTLIMTGRLTVKDGAVDG